MYSTTGPYMSIIYRKTNWRYGRNHKLCTTMLFLFRHEINISFIHVDRHHKMCWKCYLFVLFNDAGNSWDYMASVTDEGVSMQHRWN